MGLDKARLTKKISVLTIMILLRLFKLILVDLEIDMRPYLIQTLRLTPKPSVLSSINLIGYSDLLLI